MCRIGLAAQLSPALEEPWPLAAGTGRLSGSDGEQSNHGAREPGPPLVCAPPRRQFTRPVNCTPKRPGCARPGPVGGVMPPRTPQAHAPGPSVKSRKSGIQGTTPSPGRDGAAPVRETRASFAPMAGSGSGETSLPRVPAAVERAAEAARSGSVGGPDSRARCRTPAPARPPSAGKRRSRRESPGCKTA